MPDLTKVTFCGLYCGLCSTTCRIPQRAAALRESMHLDGWDRWGRGIPDFNEFWSFLDQLIHPPQKPSCRENTCGNPQCGIRECAKERGINVCPYCSQYPCERIGALGRAYVNLLADGRRMKEIGLERWIGEQEKRRAAGFCYADIRCSPVRREKDK